MFGKPLGRLRFFAWSAAVMAAEVVAILLCIHVTIGFDGLANSPPGPTRQGLALAMLVMSLVFVAVRGVLAWRRSADAGGLRWVLGGYVVFSFFFAILQAGTFLVYDFEGDNSSFGLNLLGLAITGFWFRILLAAPVGGDWDADAFAAEVSAGLKPREAPPQREAPSAGSVARSAAPLRKAGGRNAGFGRRGLA